MKKTVITFGLISGAVSSALMMGVNMPFAKQIGFDRAEIVGYTTIVLSMLLVYFGVRSYRDNVAEGYITFGKAFGVGISIVLISCVLYVATWEVLYYNVASMHAFTDEYSAYEIAKLKASGASAAAVQAQIEQMQKFKVLYENPIYNSLMTFIEPFPVGLVFALISAAILRKKPQLQSQAQSA